MMAALLGVVWSAIRETSQLRQSELARLPTTQLVAQMRRDFLNARGMLVTSSGVTLHGFLQQDSQRQVDTLRVGRVRYDVVVYRSHRITRLLRRTSGPRGNNSEPVWYGFGSLQIEPLEESDAEDALLALPEAGGLPPVPGSFRVTMLGDQGNVLWREVIHHHAN